MLRGPFGMNSHYMGGEDEIDYDLDPDEAMAIMEAMSVDQSQEKLVDTDFVASIII